MKQQITNYVRAGYPALYIISHEEQRVEHVLKAVAQETEFGFYAWSITDGIVTPQGEQIPDTQDPLVMLDKFNDLDEKSILVLRDFHMFLEQREPLLVRKIKDAVTVAKSKNRVLVTVGCQLKLQPELEKEITVLEFSLPDREQLRFVLEEVAECGSVKLNGNTDPIIDAASGLTTIEAENAFAKSIIECGTVTAESVAKEKANTVRKNGLLEVVESNISVKDIGGLENLKRDLSEKRNLFTKSARDYGLPTPRGLLVVGQPGTGKSLTASATKNIFNIPLLRLEAGKLFNSLVGASEANWRSAFATAKAIAPCVFWIDEVDGLFEGGKSSGHTDGGTTSRIIKAVLQDMQYNSEGIFFMFTANDIDGLPDPLIDRLDVWSVDLPNQTEREAILRIHIAKRERKPDKFNIPALAKRLDGFSGRQIEQVWLKALTLAFNDKGREPKNMDVEEAASRFVATSVTMADAIERRRKRLQNRATPASAPEAVVASTGRKLAK